MKTSLLEKLQRLSYRYTEIGGLLSDPEVINNQSRYRELSKEYSQLELLVRAYKQFQTLTDEAASTDAMLADVDDDMRDLVEEELQALRLQLQQVEGELQLLLLPVDPNDECNIFLEVRAGTGGDEAAIFVGDLFRMYSRFAESKKWRVQIVSANESGQGGYKEIIAEISGDRVYSQLKFESGAHRVQRYSSN